MPVNSATDEQLSGTRHLFEGTVAQDFKGTVSQDFGGIFSDCSMRFKRNVMGL